MTNYYTLLGLTPTATDSEIKKAYRKLSKKFHPDANQGDTFYENMFKQIQEAYETLSDPQKRAAYDISQGLTATTTPPEVLFFGADKQALAAGDQVTFEWQTQGADKVEISRMGQVAASGQKTLKIKQFNTATRSIKLTATNTRTGASVAAKLTLYNQAKATNIPPSGQQQGQPHSSGATPPRQSTPKDKKAETFWGTDGRLGRGLYFGRLLVLAVPLALGWAMLIDDYGSIANFIAVLFVFVCGYGVIVQSVKRFHDMNQSGWLALVLLVPYANILALLILMFARGTAGVNNYGPAPQSMG